MAEYPFKIARALGEMSDNIETWRDGKFFVAEKNGKRTVAIREATGYFIDYGGDAPSEIHWAAIIAITPAQLRALADDLEAAKP